MSAQMKRSRVLIGLQYGDEGKARVLDKIIDDTDIVARFNGGANAGHTLKVDDVEIALHQIPSGIFYEEMQLYIGSGNVVNPTKTVAEIEDIESKGISLDDRLLIASNVSLVQPHHIVLDSRHGKDIGTTCNGIGPVYADQAMRAEGSRIKNVKLGDFLNNKEAAIQSVKENLEEAVSQLGLESNEIDQATLVNQFVEDATKLEAYLCEDPLYLNKQVESGKKVFFEGANSIMLDPVAGVVPYTTSSRTLAANAYIGGDLSLKYHDKTIGVAKAIMSRVGNGPFISEFGGETSEQYCAEDHGNAHTKEYEKANFDPKELVKSDDMLEVGIGLRMLGNEYGASTKRPRRIGALDLVMLRQNVALNGVDELYINKFDLLRDFSETSLPGIPIVTAYELDGKVIDYMPTSEAECRRAKPIVEYEPAFTEDITDVRDYEMLPTQVKSLIDRIESEVGTKVCGIGVGPERDQFVRITPYYSPQESVRKAS